MSKMILVLVSSDYVPRYSSINGHYLEKSDYICEKCYLEILEKK